MQTMPNRLVAVACLLLFTAAARGETSLWRVTFETNWLGPAEAYVRIEHDGDAIRGVSLSGATAVLAELPGDQVLDDGLVVFEAERQGDGSYAGMFIAPWREGKLSMRVDHDILEGSVEGGAFNGGIRGVRASEISPIRDYAALLTDFDAVMNTKIFDPSELGAPGYVAFRDTIGRVTTLATDDFDLLFGIAWSWNDDPFSHFSFKRSPQSAQQMFAHFDNYRVGFDAATVEFEDGIAILKVRTMMGVDTIEQIEAAFQRIATERPKALIIDLRGNTGGAFAVKPLVEHVIDEPVDAGYFLSQVWNRQHDRLPGVAEVMATAPWQGWSVVSFWLAVQESAILRVQFQPAEPNFDGPVFILLDNTAASATELAADAFRASGDAQLIGETTAGQMLSQSMFDVADGFLVTLPVADYYSLTHGRIEGKGVPVDIEVPPQTALDVARQRIAGLRH